MKQENELYSEGQYPTTMALTKTIVQKRDSRTTRERLHTARGDETGEAMTTKKHVQAIVRQLRLIDLGEAQQYWGNETIEKGVNVEVQNALSPRQTRSSERIDESDQNWSSIVTQQNNQF